MLAERPGNFCVLGGRDPYTPYYVGVDVAINVSGLLGNLLVVLSVVKYKALRTATNLFVVSLAASDLLVCLNIPFYVTFYFDVPYVCAKYPCLTRYAITIYCEVVSVLTLTGVAVDRYFAIVHAMSYHRLCALYRRWAVGAICAIYAYVALLILPIFGLNTWNADIPECDLVFVVSCTYALLVVGLHVLLGLVTTVALSACIYRVARHQMRIVASLELNHRLHRERRTALTMGLVLCAHVLSLAPFLIVIVLRYLDAVPEDQRALSHSKKVVMCLYFAKSSINPLIYGWKTKDFRCAFKKLLLNKNNCKCGAALTVEQ